MTDIPQDSLPHSETPPSPSPSSARSRLDALLRRLALPLKLGLLGFLLLISIIPLEMIQSLILERQYRQFEAEAEIAAAWGGPQDIVGPILVLPFEKELPETKGPGDFAFGPQLVLEPEKKAPTRKRVRAYILPKLQSVSADIQAEARRRGIYDVQVFGAELGLAGHFAYPDLKALEIEDPDLVLWEDARIEYFVSDLSGLRQTEGLTWNGKPLDLRIDRRLGEHGGVVTAPVDLAPDLASWKASFDGALSVHGSGTLGVKPLGRETTLEASADWPHPSFAGAFLPDESQIDDQGFNAIWTVSRFGRHLPQQWRGDKYKENHAYDAHDEEQFALIRLVDPVDHYLKSERAAKYGLLFVVLVFGAVFVCEVLSGGRVHVLQYGMIAAALCLFFLLLLSLAETVGFAAGYWLAALASLALIAWYLAKVMGSWRRSAGIGTLLLGIYGYLFTTLQSEDRALLLGSLLLFAALAATMVATRNLDWYRLTNQDQRRSLSQAPRSGQP